MKLTKFLICATGLTLAMFSANKASALVLMGDDVLTLNVTFHTQEIDYGQSGIKYKIVDKTLNTIDVLNALAKDLGVTSNGVVGFPKGSYLVVAGDSNTVVKSQSGQIWDVSPYLQYSLASDVVLGHGTAPPISPGGVVQGLSYTSLVHVHFEDADHVADFTGLANSQPTGPVPASVTSLPAASGSGMLNGKPALITAKATLKFVPLLIGGPLPVPNGK